MAKKSNQKGPPAFIDYEGASAAAESANQGNAFADCKGHWKKALFKQHRVGGIVWGIKEQTNLSRLFNQFEAEEIKLMMDLWAKKEIQYATNFGMFYKNRYVLHERVTPKEYDW